MSPVYSGNAAEQGVQSARFFELYTTSPGVQMNDECTM